MVNTLTNQILERTDAVLALKYLQAALAEEQIRRIEFREWLTPAVKAEFVNGNIVTHSPVKRGHWNANDLLSSLLSFYVRIKELGRIGTEKVMIGLTRNDYEPDLVFFSKDKIKDFTDDQVIFPAPDFVVEILSKSTQKTDRTTKKDDYALHGVKEYWIIDTEKKLIEQYILHKGDTEYFPAKIYLLGADIKSYAIEGFEIPVAAVFDEKINTETMKAFVK